MVRRRGRAEVDAFFDRTPKQLMGILRGAGRAGGDVIATEAKVQSVSDEVDEAIIVKSRVRDGIISVLVTIEEQWPKSLATWLEYGTSPHFISVDTSQARGRSVRRVNEQAREPGSSPSLVIGGKFVGKTVFHPGARAHPLFRPALDLKGRDAIAAAQAYINARVSPRGLRPSEGDGE